MKKAIFPGSFNPFHKGHLNILKKANDLFDQVIIFIGVNPEKPKSDLLNVKKQIENVLKNNNLNNLVIFGEELTVNVAQQYECQFLIRGIRNSQDLIYEQNLYWINKKLCSKIETIYFLAEFELNEINSSKLK